MRNMSWYDMKKLEALGAIGNPDAIEVLETYLNDEHVEVSESCEVALDLLNWVSNSIIS